MILIFMGVVCVILEVLLYLKGCFEGFVICVLIVNVFLVDLFFVLEKVVIVDVINVVVKVVSEGVLKGVLVYEDCLFVFMDFNYDVYFLIFVLL